MAPSSLEVNLWLRLGLRSGNVIHSSRRLKFNLHRLHLFMKLFTWDGSRDTAVSEGSLAHILRQDAFRLPFPIEFVERVDWSLCNKIANQNLGHVLSHGFLRYSTAGDLMFHRETLVRRKESSRHWSGHKAFRASLKKPSGIAARPANSNWPFAFAYSGK